MFRAWQDVVISNKFNLMHELSDEQIGVAINKGREDGCLSRTEVAVVVGISPESLKAYEKESDPPI